MQAIILPPQRKEPPAIAKMIPNYLIIKKIKQLLISLQKEYTA
jgi:hypothetical protein